VEDYLAEHADWLGPVKLLRCEQGTYQRIDVFLGTGSRRQSDPLLDHEAAAQREALLSALAERAEGHFGSQVEVPSWAGPPAEAILEWLLTDGHAAAVDQEGNIRLTLTRPGCDGQVHIECRPERLRISMPLTPWQSLTAGVEAAALCLAGEANARTRLVRIAWQRHDDKRRCVAQVDLTGLPPPDENNAAARAMWRGMIEMAVAGLELTLRRLGRELVLLAAGADAELAACVAEDE